MLVGLNLSAVIVDAPDSTDFRCLGPYDLVTILRAVPGDSFRHRRIETRRCGADRGSLAERTTSLDTSADLRGMGNPIPCFDDEGDGRCDGSVD